MSGPTTRPTTTATAGDALAGPGAVPPPADPWDLLDAWLPDDEDPVRPTMTVGTVDEHGRPDARTQLLTHFDDEGFYLHTDARSRKCAHLAANPWVSLVLHFPDALRQLVVQGVAEPAPADELAWAYAHRSPYLRQLAWVNGPGLALAPLAERLAAWSRFRVEHGAAGPDDPIAGLGAPDTWVGYLVRPVRLTFWEGRPDAPSHRVEYASPVPGRRGASWGVRHLAG